MEATAYFFFCQYERRVSLLGARCAHAQSYSLHIYHLGIRSKHKMDTPTGNYYNSSTVADHSVRFRRFGLAIPYFCFNTLDN